MGPIAPSRRKQKEICQTKPFLSSDIGQVGNTRCCLLPNIICCDCFFYKYIALGTGGRKNLVPVRLSESKLSSLNNCDEAQCSTRKIVRSRWCLVNKRRNADQNTAVLQDKTRLLLLHSNPLYNKAKWKIQNIMKVGINFPTVLRFCFSSLYKLLYLPFYLALSEGPMLEQENF